MSGFMTSTVGKKYLMGLTGLIWVGFIFTHMAANMLILFSPTAYNQYSHALVTNKLIYVAEGGLVLALLVHIFYALSLTIQNRMARPQRYAAAGSRAKGSAFASRTMAIHGTIILAFIVIHLATFKFGTWYTTTVDGVEMRDLHRLVLEVFQSPGYVAWYVVALICLFLHLSHGVGSVFQSFGLLHPSYQKTIKCFGWLYAVVVVGGFLSQPIYVYFIHGHGG